MGRKNGGEIRNSGIMGCERRSSVEKGVWREVGGNMVLEGSWETKCVKGSC